MRCFINYRKIGLILVCIFIVSLRINAQAPCSTNFTGYDPCTAEFLSVGLDCASVEEVFRTNTCSGTSPLSTSCNVSGSNIVWGRFVITTPDVVTITWTTSNNRNIRLGLYQFTDPCDNDFDFDYGETEIACVNAGGNGVDETLSQFLAVGTYYVAARSNGGLNATSKICVYSPSATPPVTASDCGIAVDVCTSLDFTIDPNGTGATDEIPPSGSIGNPYDNNPGGSGNYGCLQDDEKNSTWMVVNISGSGDLEFTFGGNNTQVGYYDWIMYKYDGNVCTDIPANTKAPVRCNWNGIDAGGTGLADVIPSGGDVTNFEPSLPVLVGEQYIICFSNYSDVSTSVPLEFGGTASVSCTPLPIDLLSFNTTLIEEYSTTKVKVFWSTLTETNNSHFTIERSSDGTQFEYLGRVDGSGNSKEKIDYELIDDFPNANINYYRLKQTDFDGISKYFPMVMEKLPVSEKVSYYPNPTDKQLIVNINTMDEGSVIILISSLDGRQNTQTIHLQRGPNRIELKEFEQLAKGYYFVTIIDEQGTLLDRSKIVKI